MRTEFVGQRNGISGSAEYVGIAFGYGLYGTLYLVVLACQAFAFFPYFLHFIYRHKTHVEKETHHVSAYNTVKIQDGVVTVFFKKV